MSLNSYGHVFRVTTWGESHGPALGATVDGCPPGVTLSEADIQVWLDRRKPGQNKYTTQRREADAVQILSGVFEGQTTGTPIQLMIENTDQRSKDYGDIAEKFRPGHADITYWQKYGIRDYRGGGRSSARETAARVAAGGVARAALAKLAPGLAITGYMVGMGEKDIDRTRCGRRGMGRLSRWAAQERVFGGRDDRGFGSRLPSRFGRAGLCQAGHRSGSRDDVDQCRQRRRNRRRYGRSTPDRRSERGRDQHGAERAGVFIEPRGRHLGWHFDRTGRGGPICRQADVIDSDTAQDNYQVR